MKSRIVILFVFFIGLWSALIIRGAYLQVIPNEKLARLQKKQFETMITIPSRRGDIFDRSGKELAVTVASYSLYADPQILKNPYATAKKLSKILKKPWRKIYEKIKQKKRRFVWLGRQLPGQKVDSLRRLIKKYKIKGVRFIEEPKRVYPNQTMLSQVIGFVGRDGGGLEGLEHRYESHLQAEVKRISVQRDARGRPLLLDGGLVTNKPEGQEIHLTIDSELQFVLQQELQEAVNKYDANSAVGVILDARTSEVLAMANAPDYNLNYPRQFSRQRRKNRAVTDAFEPGSVLKTFAFAGALRENLIQPNTPIDCGGGTLKVGGRTIREADAKHVFKILTASEVLAYSSNVGTAKIAFKLGAKKLRRALLDFGFGRSTKVGLPGEASGSLRKLPWRPHLLSNISFGHGVSATPLQIASAYASIANGGILKKPWIIKSMGAPGSDSEVQYKEQSLHRVMSEKKAEILRHMLVAATAPKATGYNARIPGFPVAGKTGTAQKADLVRGGYEKGAYISNFAGFVPANDPRFVIYVAVDHPKKKYYASSVAAPVFSKVARYAVRKAGLEPILLSPKNIISGGLSLQPLKILDKSARKKAKDFLKNKDDKYVPYLIGFSLREVYNRIHSKDIKIQVEGSGLVSKMFPEPGEVIEKNQIIKLKLERPK